MANAKYYGTGRRKKSVARVYLVPGTGKKKNLLQEYILYREQERSQSIKEISMSILDWKH